MTKKMSWKYGENKYQKYYELKIDGQYLCVFANYWNPNVWMGMYENILIHDKTANDRQRKKQGLLKGCDFSLLHSDRILCSESPEYMMKKVLYCFKHNLKEVSR